VRKVENLRPSCAVVMKYGNLNFLESSGPVRACNGTALPFTHVVDAQTIVMCLKLSDTVVAQTSAICNCSIELRYNPVAKK